MPKVELHRHLEGSVRLDTVHEEGQRHGVPQPRNKAELERYIQTRTPFASLDALLRFVRLAHATPAELQEQLKLCFRFGLCATADPQLWWDAHRYAISLGHSHGLADFMPQAAIALPVAGGRVVSSRDVMRLDVALPYLLGHPRKPPASLSKSTLTPPPSVAGTWAGRVRWELAMVQAFGVTFPKASAERLSAAAVGTDLLYAIAEARDEGDTSTLHALAELLDVYERRMGGLLPTLRTRRRGRRRKRLQTLRVLRCERRRRRRRR